jgi:hypothetical protein
MSMSLSDNIPSLGPASKTVDDDFKILSEGDPLDSLNVDKPIPGEEEQDDKPKSKKAAGEIELDENNDKDDKDDEGEVDELAEIEEDLAEIDPEKLELVTPVRRREILKKFPTLFKEFPYLEKAYYREQQFTEIHGTIEEAKQAKADQEVLHKFSQDVIVDGNVKSILKLIKEGNPDKFNEVADGYLDHLYEIDRNAYQHVTGNMVKEIIANLWETGTDENKAAALALNQHIFGTSKYKPPTKLAKETKPEDKSKEEALLTREREFVERQVKTAANEISTRVNNTIKSYIETNIDPKGNMSEYVKTKAIGDSMEKITELMSKDARFKAITDKLWEKAAKANFSEESKTEIRRAFLSKAKSLLEPVIKSSRNIALKGASKNKQVDDVQDEQEQPERQRMRRSNESRSDSKPKSLPDTKGKSSYELLNALMGD